MKKLLIFSLIFLCSCVPASKNALERTNINLNDAVKQIVLNSKIEKLDNLGNVLSVKSNQKIIDDGGLTYQKWYNYAFNNIGGVFLFAPSFNGVLSEYFKEPNLYCWNPLANFTFFQPVIFDVTTTETSATATIVDGLETIEFSIDGLVWQVSNVFEGLTANTEYTIYARNTVDLWESKVVCKTLETVNP